MLVPNRHGSTPAYRYGFQGQEKDDELKGEGNSLNYEFRMHDPRVGRFFSVDPLSYQYAYYSPYAFSGNRVLDRVELEGLEPDLPPLLNDAFTWLERKPGPYIEKAGKEVGKFIVSFHPAIIATNTYNAYANGEDIYGEKMSKGEVAFEVVASLPLTKPLKAFKLVKYADEAAPYIVKLEKIAEKSFRYSKDGKWSKYLYRENLQTFTKGAGKATDDAHHMLPKDKKFADFFEKTAVDVNNPQYMKWMDRSAHTGTSFSKEYGKLWDKFIETNRTKTFTPEQLMNVAKKLEKAALKLADKKKG